MMISLTKERFDIRHILLIILYLTLHGILAAIVIGLNAIQAIDNPLGRLFASSVPFLAVIIAVAAYLRSNADRVQDMTSILALTTALTIVQIQFGVDMIIEPSSIFFLPGTLATNFLFVMALFFLIEKRAWWKTTKGILAMYPAVVLVQLLRGQLLLNYFTNKLFEEAGTGIVRKAVPLGTAIVRELGSLPNVWSAVIFGVAVAGLFAILKTARNEKIASLEITKVSYALGLCFFAATWFGILGIFLDTVLTPTLGMASFLYLAGGIFAFGLADIIKFSIFGWIYSLAEKKW